MSAPHWKAPPTDDSNPAHCALGPPGWWCSRAPSHAGPCALRRGTGWLEEGRYGPSDPGRIPTTPIVHDWGCRRRPHTGACKDANRIEPTLRTLRSWSGGWEWYGNALIGLLGVVLIGMVSFLALVGGP